MGLNSVSVVEGRLEMHYAISSYDRKIFGDMKLENGRIAKINVYL
jgi:hypothetical protein